MWSANPNVIALTNDLPVTAVDFATFPIFHHQVLGDQDRASFMTSCYQGHVRALWVQPAKMAIIACELNSPKVFSLPQWFNAGQAAGIDKRDTSMLTLHWVSAAELHYACHHKHGAVRVWVPHPVAQNHQAAWFAGQSRPVQASWPPRMVSQSIQPYSVLKLLVSDSAFSTFFAHLASAGHLERVAQHPARDTRAVVGGFTARYKVA